MVNPHIHIPYRKLEDYLHFIQKHRLDLEIFFSAHSLETIKDSDIIKLREKLSYNPSLSIHAPFMDLSPGAVDSKVRAVTLERFSYIFDIAEILKPEAIVFHSGYEKWKYALKIDIWLEKSVMTWRALLKTGVDMGLKIVIEKIFEDEPTNLRLLMEGIHS